jgi:hypothetical protein
MVAPGLNPAAAAATGLPNCWQCRHFGISHDPRLPYLCRLMGIKTLRLPGAEVLAADGEPCHGHAPRRVTRT